MQPRGVLQEDGAHPLPCEDGQGPRFQGPDPREQREEGRAGRARRAHRPGGRPPAEGRHQLAGDIRAAARPGLRRRPHHGEDPHRRAPGPRAREEAAGGPAGLPRAALQDGARRGLPDGLGLRRGRAPRRRAGADRLLRHGLPPLRERPRRVLPERAPGEPPHRDAARVLGAGRARDRAHRQHEERGRPPRCRRPARLAGRLRRVHGRRRLPHQAVQAAPPLYEGQGGEARPLREGELPRGKVLHRP